MPETAWTQSLLADVVPVWYVGSTPSRKEDGYFGDAGIPWVRVEDMTADIIVDTAEHLTHLGVEASAIKLVPPNAVLVSTAGTIGKVAMAGATLTMNQAVQALVANPQILLPKYLYYYLKYVRPQLEKLANHVTIPHLPKTTFMKFPIFYPDLDEQRAIVIELDRVEALSVRKKESVSRLDDYLLSLFTSCFKDKLLGAEQKQLGSIAELSSGIRTKQTETGEGRPLVNGFGGQAFTLRDTSCFICAIPPKKPEKYLLKQNDILIRRKLPSSSEPCAILVSSQAETTLLGANLLRIRIIDDSVLPAYLLAWLVLSHRQGNFPMMDNYHVDVDISGAKSILVPMLPVEQQARFVRYFAHYLDLVDLVNASGVQLDSLLQSTLEYAFAGRLTYSWRTRHGVPHPSRTIFDVEPTWTADDETALYRQNHACLTAGMRAVIAHMSAFQQALLDQLLRTDKPKAVHELLGELRTGGRNGFDRHYGIQDALAAIDVFELLGFVERSDLLLEMPDHTVDSNSSPVQIQLQLLNRDIFKESSDETP